MIWMWLGLSFAVGWFVGVASAEWTARHHPRPWR